MKAIIRIAEAPKGELTKGDVSVKFATGYH